MAVNVWNAGKKITPIGKLWINITLPTLWTACILLPIYVLVRFFSIFPFLKDFLKIFSIPSVIFASVFDCFRASSIKNTLIHIHHAELLKGLDVGVFVDFIKRLTQENCKVLLSFEDTADKDVKAFLSALKIAFGSPYVFQLPSKEVAYLAFEKEDKAAYGALFEVLEDTLVEKHIELFTIAKRSCEALKRWHELVVAVAWEETVSEKALWEKLTPLTIDGLISLKEHQEFKMTANEEDRPLEQCCCANIDDQAYLLNFPDGKKALRAAVIRLKKDK
ncbi:hypothetical protein FAI40_03820 [Acetobacteraceae bacterium]|nr:hypothetical protein FAI40_03820 [Acetobacteraceae bacterium]